MNETIAENLKAMMGKENPFYPQEILTESSNYNDLLFSYYFYYCGFGQVSLRPSMLPSYLSIDRVIRDLPNREKNLPREEKYREHYSQS